MEIVTPDSARFFMTVALANGRARHRAGLTAALPHYRFQPEDVHAVHLFKHGQGRGYWFRLHDDRVFDDTGQRSESDPAFYDGASH